MNSAVVREMPTKDHRMAESTPTDARSRILLIDDEQNILRTFR